MKKALVTIVVLILCVRITTAQTTAFTYHGTLNTSGIPASGNHDFEFAMFNGGGIQIGSTLTRLNVPVSAGVLVQPAMDGRIHKRAVRSERRPIDPECVYTVVVSGEWQMVSGG